MASELRDSPAGAGDGAARRVAGPHRHRPRRRTGSPTPCGWPSRPPEPAARVPADLAVRLAESAGAAMTSDLAETQWMALLDAVVDSPVRRTVKPAGLPDPAGEETAGRGTPGRGARPGAGPAPRAAHPPTARAPPSHDRPAARGA